MNEFSQKIFMQLNGLCTTQSAVQAIFSWVDKLIM